MQDLIKHLPAVLYEYVILPDGSRRFEFISDACESMLGLPARSLLHDAQTLDSIVHQDDVQDLYETSTTSERAGKEWNWQGRIWVAGKIKWLEFRSNHALKPDGSVIRRGVIQDITLRKQRMDESEEKYLESIQRLPIGIIIHKGGKLLFINTQARAILNAADSLDLLGTFVMDFVHPDFHQHIVRGMKDATMGITGVMEEQKFIRIDGQTIYVEATTFPLTFKGEACFQIIFRDVTERKQTEERTKKNETLLAQLFQNVPIAVVLLNDSGKVEQVNKGFEEMFGFTLTELKGRSINDFIVPEELTHEGVDLNNLITNHRVVSIETARRHRNGKLVDVILYGMPVTLENQTIGIYGVYVDITERKRVEEELKIRNGELDNFVYKVSHDLRAPLSSILGLVNLAKLPGNTDNPMDYIDIIGTKVEHLDHFIGDVLSHSKNLKMEISTAKVDFERIIQQTFSDLNYLEGTKEMRRSIKIEGIEFYSDPWRISEILRNLISNAIKYRRLESEFSEINIKITTDHLRTEIIFSDNGIGISDASLSKIFEMFYRATEQSDGSGIGLYIVKNAVEKLGGQIYVASRVGQGTRFNIILPNRINNVIHNTPQMQVEQ
ncbi:PAS domain-containing sensor histidine kinase [Chryseolinea sp. H1M3-3]|uniref:PAS domain-containing sensor histidine kinase n=1 Tax=Chryseolinea sp. H1M3-3 TaxID=3034144 RepID=UPI0023EDB108|nr:PAS domain-containing sensor histidine kinase [Chryseolinea sp. H1M3-3]